MNIEKNVNFGCMERTDWRQNLVLILHDARLGLAPGHLLVATVGFLLDEDDGLFNDIICFWLYFYCLHN
jgi:prophage tail gpP-like protein